MMRDQTSGGASVWTTIGKALAAFVLMAATLAMSLLAPTPARASAFPGLNGKIVFASTRTSGTGVNNPTGDLEIFSMNPDGSGLEQLTFNQAVDANPSYSSDGKKIAFDSQRTGNFEVFVMNANGTGQKNLTKNSAFDRRPSFSPNGKKIAFDSNRGANKDNIFVMNSDGTQPTKLTTNASEDFDATFSPNGDEIAFVSERGGGDSEVFAMNPNGTSQSPLTANDFDDEDPAFSPGGDKIAFASNRDGGGNALDFDVFVMNSDGSSQLRHTGSFARDDRPAFSPDGQKIAYVSTQDGGDEDVLTMDASFQQNVTDLTANTDSDEAPDWQPSSTFTVTSASDSGDGLCDSVCTLREALNASNDFRAQPRTTIAFDIPGGGVQTIAPQSALPPITRPVTIDGYSQPGASKNTLAKGTDARLRIELSGVNSPGGDGLTIQGPSSSGSVVRGLAIDRFAQGIRLEGGTAANRIEGNFVGTDPTGTVDRGNESGLVLSGTSQNVVGGKTPAARNLLSGNDFQGLLVVGSQGNRMLGNLVGTTAGGTAPLGNTGVGVALAGTSVSNNRVGDGTAAGSNTVAFNGDAGIAVLDQGGTRNNPISRNSVFSNVGLGIDLGLDGPTANDPGDSDAGPNDLQNKPVITSAKTVSGKTTISGKLGSNPNRTYKVEFFSNPAGTDEGKTFLGQKSVTTVGSGTATFTFSPASKAALGQTITATATDPAGNTSEFSAPKTVASS